MVALYFHLFFIVWLNVVLGDQTPNIHIIKNYSQLDLPKSTGPESLAFDCNGQGPYTGLSDGTILKWQGHNLGWTEFAISASPNRTRKECNGAKSKMLERVCGRPQGLKFNPKTCELYIADAYYGLQVVGPKGGVAKQLATEAEGITFKYLNDLDIDTSTGVVYFSESSIRYQRWQNDQALSGKDKSGRFMKYDPRTKKVTVLSKGLAFANGVALSKDNSYALVAEFKAKRILKYSLVGNYTHLAKEVFAQLKSFPDNIERDVNGEFWVALSSDGGNTNQRSEDTSLRQKNAASRVARDTVGVKLGEDGEVIEALDASNFKPINYVSEVHEKNGVLWIASSEESYVGMVKNN